MTDGTTGTNWMRGRVVAAMGLAITMGGTAIAVQSVVAGADWETLPPTHEQTERALKGAAVSMAEAMSKAESAAGGVAVSARAVASDDGKVQYEFLCTAGGVMKRVEVDGQTGAVIAATLTLNAAVAKALERVPGVVKMADGNLLAEPPIYRVQVLASGTMHELTIDASSGAILEETMRGRFPGVAATGDIQTTASGLKFIDVVEGTGATPAGPQSRVKVHYTGYFVDGSKFDSSVDRGQPATFALNQVIAGWTEGVASMKVGGKRKLIVPYTMGYGEAGRGPIPPRATLIFDVELLGLE